MELVKKILKVLLVIIIVPLLFYNCLTFIKVYNNPNKTPDIMGYKSFLVLSGSMVPTFDIDDLVISKVVPEEELEVQDIISFNDHSSIVTHRIVEIEEVDGKKHYITKGDANNTNDAGYVVYENIEGEMVRVIPKVGKILFFLKSKEALIVLMIIVFAYSLYKYNKD